ncbi:MAG: acyl carrier protein [Candidatus Omnitrophica bacterium]|nr:acyl carrier protein [Candidatus Omnitrophota bacterium]
MEFLKGEPEINAEECEQLLSRVAKILSLELKLGDKKIGLNTRFKEDLDTDSFDTIYIVMVLEKEFDIDISDEAAEKLKTVGDAIEYIHIMGRQDDVQGNIQ